MDPHSTLVFVHLLLFVFWLGTDVGVFLAAKISERGDLGVETRATVMQLAMVLDRLPRSALALILPSGLQLAVNTGQLALPPYLPPFAWIAGIAWLAILWTGFLKPHTPTEQRAMLFNFAMNALLAVVVIAYALYLFLAGGAAPWLASKVLVLGLIFVSGVMLDVRFKPAVEAFVDIVGEGATPARNEKYSRAIGPVYPIVLLIYAFTLVAAWLGVSKPTF